MSTILTFISGKKTYVIAVVAALTAAAQALGYDIPSWVYVIEGAVGLGAVRVAISKSNAPYDAPKN
jgi:hypothetical protein